MGTSAFQAGAVVAINGCEYTLLRKVTDALWQLEESKTKRIKEVTDDELRRAYVERELVFSVEQPYPASGVMAKGKPFQDIAPHLFEEAKVRRAYVMAIIDLPSSKEAIKPDIERLWIKLQKPKNQPSASNVLKWKARYLAAGKDIVSLVALHERKGNRKSIYPNELLEIVADVIDDVYMKPERPTNQGTLDAAIIRVSRENELRPTSLQLPLPSRRLVVRMIGDIPAYEKCLARYGRAAAQRTFRSVQKHRTTNLPLHRAEIDHTPLDLMVIDDKTALPLGRPYLTACIDDYSRCFLGVSVSFQPPSYLSVARCLRNSFLPKTTLKEEFPRVKHDWEAHGVMSELVVDNGPEFHSASLEAACYSLGIEIHYAPRKTGWFKAKIERAIGSLNRGVAHGTPGTTFSNILEKEEYDPSKQAVVRFSTLQEIVRIWIADYYHQKPHRSLSVSPAVMWSSNIKRHDIIVPDDPATLDAILGRIETRVLTHKGIELDCLRYNSPDLADLRNRLGDTLDVELRIDDANIGKIIVLSPDKTQMFEVNCLNVEYADGLSRWQHNICRRFAQKKLRRDDPMAWLEAKETIAKIIEEELSLKPRKSAKNLARYQEASSLNEATAVSSPPTQWVPPPEPAKRVVTSLVSPPIEQPRRLAKSFKPLVRDRSASIAHDDFVRDSFDE